MLRRSGSPVICFHEVSGERVYKLHGTVIVGNRAHDKPPCSFGIDERKTAVTNLKYFDTWIKSYAFPSGKF